MADYNYTFHVTGCDPLGFDPQATITKTDGKQVKFYFRATYDTEQELHKVFEDIRTGIDIESENLAYLIIIEPYKLTNNSILSSVGRRITVDSGVDPWDLVGNRGIMAVYGDETWTPTSGPCFYFGTPDDDDWRTMDWVHSRIYMINTNSADYTKHRQIGFKHSAGGINDRRKYTLVYPGEYSISTDGRNTLQKFEWRKTDFNGSAASTVCQWGLNDNIEYRVYVYMPYESPFYIDDSHSYSNRHNALLERKDSDYGWCFFPYNGKEKFYWIDENTPIQKDVHFVEDIITATKWKELQGTTKTNASYTGTFTTVSAGDMITAQLYNEIATVLDIEQVAVDDMITASCMMALQEAVNSI